MTQENIAFYLGWTLGHPDKTETRWSAHWFTPTGIRHERLHFDSDWNWLMPAVHKCLKICHEASLNEWENSFADKFMTCQIEPLYKEVLNFIDWDNKSSL